MSLEVHSQEKTDGMLGKECLKPVITGSGKKPFLDRNKRKMKEVRKNIEACNIKQDNGLVFNMVPIIKQIQYHQQTEDHLTVMRTNMPHSAKTRTSHFRKDR